MTPSAPWALALAALALPVVAAYFHRRRRTPRRVPSAMLLRVIAGPATPRSRAIAKPRHLLSLLLVLLALAGLVAALVDLQRDDDEPRNTIVVLDTSASMGTVDWGGDQSRLAVAVERLETSLDRLGQQDRVALVTADDQATVRVGLTEDHGRVLAVARELKPAGSSDGSLAALRIAEAMCRANDHAAVVLLSDGVGVSTPTVTRCAVEHVPIGRIGPNAGISALSVREADALGLAEIYLAVTADLDKPAPGVEVEIDVDGQLREVVPLDLPAKGEVKRLLRVPLPPGRRVTATLHPVEGDTLAADDVAWAPRRIGGRIRTLLVTSTRLSFTAEALRLHPRVDLSVIGPNDATPTERFDLVVLEAERDPAALPEASHLVALGAPATGLGFAVERADVEGAEIVRWSFDDPLFRFVSFDEVQIPRASILAVGEGQTSLIDSADGPLAVAGSVDGQPRIAFGFVPHESDFVLRVGFVNLVANLVEWAAPPAPEGEEAESFAMPASESRVDPPDQVPGTTRGEFSGPVRTRMAIWRLLAWIVAGLLALEWLLPALALGLSAAWARFRARFGRGTGRRAGRTSS